MGSIFSSRDDLFVTNTERVFRIEEGVANSRVDQLNQIGSSRDACCD